MWVHIHLKMKNGDTKMMSGNHFSQEEAEKIHSDFTSFVETSIPKVKTYSVTKDGDEEPTLLTVRFDEVAFID